MGTFIICRICKKEIELWSLKSKEIMKSEMPKCCYNSLDNAYEEIEMI